MDQRDTQKNTESFKGQSYTTQANTAFYDRHTVVSVISKKTEKIGTAIYMVTDFVHESEPLRYQLRTLALALITGTKKLAARSAEPQPVLSDDIGRTIDETVTFITLASTIGLISEMNGNILVHELVKIKGDMIRIYGEKKVIVTTHPGYANIILKPEMFEISEVPQQAPVADKGHEIFKGHTTSITTPGVTEQAEKMRNTVEQNEKEFLFKKTDIGMKIARRNDVLAIVRNKGKVSIKDIVSILKDTSEKTVQRELLALVREGVLAKEGEKRWSTYRIAS
jgi:hypothetical protein